MNVNKILIMTSEFPPLPGGIGNHAFNLSYWLRKNGYKVIVLADQRTTLGEETEFDNKQLFKIHRTSIRRPRWIMYFKRLRSLWKLSDGCDLIIATGKFPLWAVAALSMIRKNKSLAIIHGTEVNFSNEVLRRSINWSLKRFDKIIAVSNFTRALVSQLKLETVYVIPNGHNMVREEITDYNALQLKGSPVLLTVGNVTKRKGQLRVIRHLPNLLSDYPDLHYHCVGYRTEAEAFMEEAKDLGVENHISFHGRVPHEELQQYYAEADVNIMLSGMTDTGDVEGFGIAIIEGNSVGLPAIGSTGCGIEDAIDHGNSGCLINPEDNEALKMAIQSILENYDRFSSGSLKWAEAHHWRNIIKLYIGALKTL